MPTLDHFLLLKSFAALLAVINPIGNAPLFLSITDANSTAERNHIALVATVAVFISLTVIVVAGEIILNIFGVTIDDLRIAGGLVILLIGLSMLHAQPTGMHGSDAETAEGTEKSSPAVVPLAIPMLAGPGAMTSVLVAAQGTTSTQELAGLIAIIAAVAVTIYVTFRAAIPMKRLLGVSGMNIVVRLMGLLLAVIAVDMMATGLRGQFPILGRAAG